ncbi:hypothetical protein Ahy_A02g007973 [Arachis hypogaea]|uniref:DUF223 domain-containing protein n=1 Tax=Arachis hypogaea TaxID=3818 RepID=A0A445EE43_ARAHY|nr:hypothetical protein Ahy_A02g007973 [Arachis hypogaea]
MSFDTFNAPEYDYTYLKKMLLDILLDLGVKEFLKNKDDKSTKYTVIELEIDDGKIMECALFGNYAHELNAFLGSGNKDGAVVVLQFVRVKLYNEKIVLQNSMYDPKIFFNLEEANNAVCVVLATISHIIDTPADPDCACFVVFDKEAKQVLGKSHVEILDPLLLKMTDNVDLINKFKKAHPIQIVSTVISNVECTGGLLPTSKASSIIEGKKNNDEFEVLENAITPTKQQSSKLEDSKVEGDTLTCKKIKIENET